MTMHSPIKAEAVDYLSAKRIARARPIRGRKASGWLIMLNVLAIGAVLGVGLFDLFGPTANRTAAHTIIGSGLVLAGIAASIELCFAMRRRVSKR